MSAAEQSVKAVFMKEHQCRLCLYYGECSHEYCKVDGASVPREVGLKKKTSPDKEENDR